MPVRNLHVCYVIYCEEIWSPLLKRQVLELLQTVAASDPGLKIRLLYIFPWYWKIIRRKELKAFLQEFDAAPITLRFLPVLFPFPFPYLLPRYKKGVGLRPHEPDSSAFFWVAKLLVLPVLLKYVLLDKVSIFHSRSYPAAALVLPLKRLLRHVKLVFDPRSDYPEENLLQSDWKRNGRSFRYWKQQEKKLLQQASVTVCISPLYQQHYQKACAGFKYRVIPNNVDCTSFRYTPAARATTRGRYGFGDRVVFCYLGSMATGSWHCPYVYAELIRGFRAIAQPHLFLFLVPAGSSAQLTEVLGESGICSSEYLVVSPGYSEVPAYLSAADYGLIYLKKEKIALGTKVVEYNAVGLPVLVNSNVLSAARYVQEQQTGFVLDLALGDQDAEKTPLTGMDFRNPGAAYGRETIAGKAASLFSNSKIAADYLDTYYTLQQQV